MKHQAGQSMIPVARPYAPPPGSSSSGRWLTAAAIVLVGGACLAAGFYFVPKLDLLGRQAAQGEAARNDEPLIDPTQGKSAYQLAMEAADLAQEQAEAQYQGVGVPDKLDSYVVVVPDQPKETGPISRPVQEPVVVPQLPPGGGPLDVARAIDQEIDKKLAEAKLSASPLADDAEFLRRACLDLTGRIPGYEQTLAFLASKDPYKRSKLIDELLAGEGFGQHFANVWTDLLVKRDFDSNKGLATAAFEKWLAEKFDKNEPWNQIVHAMLTASGKESENPAIFFMLANQDNMQPAPNKLVGATGNLFMGIQIQCAECHVHPFTDKWKPSDFWGMAAFFGHTRIEREGADKKGKGGTPIVREVDSVAKKDKKDKSGPIPTGATITIPDPTNAKKTLGTARAKFFEAGEPKLGDKGPYRPAVADWVTSKKNPYFAPAMVNRTWAHFFARGLVNPVDDIKADNPPSHPAVMKLLGDEFTKSSYDVKFLIKAVCNTQAYQRTSRPSSGNKDDEVLYSHMPVKVLTADVLLDSIAVATSTSTSAGGRPMPRAPRAPAAGNLRTFFDVKEYDDDPRDYNYGIPHVLKMINTGVTQSAYQAADRLVRAAGSNKNKAIEDIYLTVLSRRPSDDETRRMLAFVSQQGDSRGYGSVFWALLNSAEFVCNR